MRDTDPKDEGKKYLAKRAANGSLRWAWGVGCLMLAWQQPDNYLAWMTAGLVGVGVVDLKTVLDLVRK